MSADQDVDDGGGAAELLFSPSFSFRVGARDATLILAALGGRLTTDDQRTAARELGDRLTALRFKAAEQHLTSARIAIERMGAARQAAGLLADPLAKPAKLA